DLSIPVSEFKQLVERQQRFLHHQDEWVELPLEKMKAAYEEMKETETMMDRKGKVSDLLRISISEQEKAHRYVKIENQSETKNYLQLLLTANNKKNHVPEQYHGILRPYQRHG